VSEENVEVVRLGTALLNEGKWNALFDLWDREVEFSDLRSAVDTPQALRGADRALLVPPGRHQVGHASYWSGDTELQTGREGSSVLKGRYRPLLPRWSCAGPAGTYPHG
jgi:hypothetical protein